VSISRPHMFPQERNISLSYPSTSQPAQLTYDHQNYAQYPNRPRYQYPVSVPTTRLVQHDRQYPTHLPTTRSAHKPASYTLPHRVDYPPSTKQQYSLVRHHTIPPEQSPPRLRLRYGLSLRCTHPQSSRSHRKPPTTTADLSSPRISSTICLSPHSPIPLSLCNSNPIELKAGRIYYLPHGKYVPKTSIVHDQKRQDGFFQHPVLVVLVDDYFAHFYALTRKPPTAVRELSMCLRFGTTSDEEGPEVLKLAPGSSSMTYETWVNLEQRFKIELGILTHWIVEVKIDPGERFKLQARVDLLEAEQNRFIYKPLDRILDKIAPGTVLLLKNHPGASTLGAPVVILENQFPRFRFLRIKEKKKNSIWDEPLSEYGARSRRMGLTISRESCHGHDGTPVMLLTAISPDLREPSYVEMARKAKWGSVSQFTTWCIPPIQLQPHSMKIMLDYITNLPEPAPGLLQLTSEELDLGLYMGGSQCGTGQLLGDMITGVIPASMGPNGVFISSCTSPHWSKVTELADE
jgi:hypothetical protein